MKFEISTGKRQRKSSAYAPRVPLEGEAPPREHNTLKDPETYHSPSWTSVRPHADDFLDIHSRGVPT